MKHSRLLTGKITPSVYPFMHNVSKWPDTSKILQQMLQDFYSAYDDFKTLCLKGLKFSVTVTSHARATQFSAR